MRPLVILFAGLFSFLYIDLQILRRSSQGLFLKETTSLDISRKKEKLKRKQKKYKKGKYKKKKFYKQKHFKLKGTKAKDSRYSNQRDLRRMHTSYA